jgi:mono/diheme cytochrome c family protein
MSCKRRIHFRGKLLTLVPCLALAIGAAGCQPMASSRPAAAQQPAGGLAFAQASCGGCHAVGRHSTSPNPQAPPFAGIVNQPGVTANTLSSWLRNAHNYPEEMKFSLDRRAVDELAAYMITLRDANYRPPI